MSPGTAKERNIFTKSMSVKMGCPRKRTWKICRHKSRRMRWGQSPREPELGTSTRHAHLQELQSDSSPASLCQTQIWGDTFDSETEGNAFYSKSFFSIW